MFEDQSADTEAERLAAEGEEREFMDRGKREVALPAYDLFADYSEMVTQFGYVSLWSTIWPLAPGTLHYVSVTGTGQSWLTGWSQ